MRVKRQVRNEEVDIEIVFDSVEPYISVDFRDVDDHTIVRQVGCVSFNRREFRALFKVVEDIKQLIDRYGMPDD